MHDTTVSQTPTLASQAMGQKHPTEGNSLPQPMEETFIEQAEQPTIHDADAVHPSSPFDAATAQETHVQDTNVQEASKAPPRTGQATRIGEALETDDAPRRGEAQTAIQTREETVTIDQSLVGLQTVRGVLDGNNSRRDLSLDNNAPNSDTVNALLDTPRPSWFHRVNPLKRLNPCQTCPSPRNVHWQMPIIMICWALAGLVGAVVHHVLNNALHGRQVRIADWVQRLGTALAFFIKVCLGSAVEAAYTQQAWRTVKKRAYKIRTIDAIFGAPHDPLHFFNRNFISQGTVPALFAALVWIIPLCAIIAPASLTSVTSLSSSTAICDNIPTMDLRRENDGLMTIYEVPGALTYIDLGKDNKTFWYDSPSTDLIRMSDLALLSENGPLQPSNPCPHRWDFSYPVSFDAPAYSCSDQPEFPPFAPNVDGGYINKSLLAPNGNFTWFGVSSIWEDEFGRPASWYPWYAAKYNTTPEVVGTWRVEPDFWIGYVVNTTEPLPALANATWRHKLTPKVLKCTMSRATHAYNLTFRRGQMIIHNGTTQLHDPLLAPKAFVAPGNSDYQAYSGAHAAGWIFRNKLKSHIVQLGQDYPPESSSTVSQTTLVNITTQFAVPDLAAAVEKKFADLILSLLALPTLKSKVLISVPCTLTQAELVWNYKPLFLALSYALAVASTLIAVVFGMLALLRNGFGAEANFSTFVAMTGSLERGDGAVVCDCALGCAPLSKRYMDRAVQFE